MCTSFPNGKPWMSIAVLVPTQSIIPSKLADYRGSQSMGSGTPFFQPGSYGDLVRRSGFVSVLRLENCQEIMMAMASNIGESASQMFPSFLRSDFCWVFQLIN